MPHGVAGPACYAVDLPGCPATCLLQRLAVQDPRRPPLHGLARALSMPSAQQRLSPPIPQFGVKQAAPTAAPQGGWLALEQLRLLPRSPQRHAALPQACPQPPAELAPFAAGPDQQLDVLAGPFDSEPPLLRWVLLVCQVKVQPGICLQPGGRHGWAAQTCLQTCCLGVQSASANLLLGTHLNMPLRERLHACLPWPLALQRPQPGSDAVWHAVAVPQGFGC